MKSLLGTFISLLAKLDDASSRDAERCFVITGANKTVALLIAFVAEVVVVVVVVVAVTAAATVVGFAMLLFEC